MSRPGLVSLVIAHLGALGRALTDETTAEDDKPCACRFCEGRASVEHVRRGRERYAQVICFPCDVRGPAVRFEPSDEWPHIQAEQIAIAKWDAMHWTHGWRAD